MIKTNISDTDLKSQFFFSIRHMLRYEYASTVDITNNIDITIGNEVSRNPRKRKITSSIFDNMYGNLDNPEEKKEAKDEFLQYLDEQRPNLEDDQILGWWKLNKQKYPQLSKMAVDYLSIPATSASVERLFSAGKNMVTDKRNRLSISSMQAVMSLKSWWNSVFEERYEEQLAKSYNRD